MGKIIRIGTRKSKLALVQTNIIIDKIKLIAPELQFEIVPISTTGDEILDKPLLQFGGKGVFVDAFETALLKGEIDLAVHSAKDMTMQLPDGLAIIGIPEREDPRDVLISYGKEIDPEQKSIIGTSSLRRQFQIEQYYQAECRSLRGNVPTRLDKLSQGEYDAIILAAAGLRRLHFEENEQFNFRYFSTEEFIPAAGQGILAVEGRAEEELAVIVSKMNDFNTSICLRTERRVLELLGAGCHEAIGVFSEIHDGVITVHAMYKKCDGLQKVKESDLVDNYLELASKVAEKLSAVSEQER